MFIANAAFHGMSVSSWARLALLKQAAYSNETLAVQATPSPSIKPGDVITADLGHGLVELKILSLSGHKGPK